MKEQIKKGLSPILRSQYLFRKAKNHLCIFLYHNVTDSPSEFAKEHNLYVEQKTFYNQLKLIKEHFTVISPLDLINKSKLGSGPNALITFDDGFKDYFSNAVPIMEELSIPSLIFINHGVVEGETFWSGLICYLCSNEPNFLNYLEKETSYESGKSSAHLFCNEDLVSKYLSNSNKEKIIEKAAQYYGLFSTPQELKENEKSSLSFLGNHLSNHYNAAQLDDVKLLKSFKDNQKALSSYSNFINFFSYPFGQPSSCYDNRTNKLLYSEALALFSAYPCLNKYPQVNKFYHRVSLENNIQSEVDFIKHLNISYLRTKLKNSESLKML